MSPPRRLPSPLAPRTPSPIAAASSSRVVPDGSRELFEEFEWAEMDARSDVDGNFDAVSDSASDRSRACGCTLMIDEAFRGLNLNLSRPRSESPQTAGRGRQRGPAVTLCRDCYQEPRTRRGSNSVQKRASPMPQCSDGPGPSSSRASPSTTHRCAEPACLSHHKHAGEYTSQTSIRDWVHTVESGRTRTFSLTSHYRNMKMRSQGYITSQSPKMPDTSSSCGSFPSLAPLSFASYASVSECDRAKDINATWVDARDHASHRGISPLPTSPSSLQKSTMASTSSRQIPYRPTFPVDYITVDEAAPSIWAKRGWREEYRTNAVDDEPMPYEDDTDENVYLHPITLSSRPPQIQLADLATALAQQEFSPLMHQTFTFALTGNETDGSDCGQPDLNATRFYPAALDELDLTNQWSPPALRSASSTSSLDPFSMDLFSPTTDFPDAASVWDDSYRSIDESSISPGDYSSSPFIGWSSASDTESKTVLPMLTMGYTSAMQPLTAIPLHQPQPIRPIPPIPVDLLDEAVANDEYIGDG